MQINDVSFVSISNQMIVGLIRTKDRTDLSRLNDHRFGIMDQSDTESILFRP